MAEQQKSQADKAREAAEAKRAEQEAKDREAAEAKEREAKANEAKAGDLPTPEPDPEGGDVRLLMARIDAQDRVIQTLTAGMAGAGGAAVGDRKSTIQVGPGAVIDPPLSGPAGPGVTSGPATQPHPASAEALALPGGVGAGQSAWAVEGAGRTIEAKSYEQLADEDVTVIRTGYYDDAIQNPGDVIRGYTGPVASWFIPTRIVGNPRATSEWNRMFVGGAHVVGEAA